MAFVGKMSEIERSVCEARKVDSIFMLFNTVQARKISN